MIRPLRRLTTLILRDIRATLAARQIIGPCEPIPEADWPWA